MKSIVATLLLILTALNFSYAQKPKIKLAPQEKAYMYRTTNFQSVGPVNEKFFLVYVDEGIVLAEHMDDKGKLLWNERIYELPRIYSQMVNNDFHATHWNGELVIYYTKHNRKEDYFELMYTKFDMQGNKTTEGAITQFKYEGTKIDNTSRMYFTFDESPDGKKIVVGTGFSKDNRMSHYIAVVDQADPSNATVTEHIKQFNEDHIYYMRNAAVSNSGDAALVIQYKESKGKERDSFNFLYTLGNDGSKAESELALKGFQLINSTAYMHPKTGDLYTCGLFVKEDADKGVGWQGFYVAKIGANLSIQSVASRGIDEEYLMHLDDNYAKRKNFYISGSYLGEIAFAENSIYAVFERHTTLTDADMIVLRVDNSFELTDTWMIPNHHTSPRAKGVFAFPYKDDLFLFYGTNGNSIKEQSMSNDGSPMRPVSNESVAAYTHLKAGDPNDERKKFFVTQDKEGAMMPITMKTYDDKIWTRLYDGKKARYGYITIEEEEAK